MLNQPAKAPIKASKLLVFVNSFNNLLLFQYFLRCHFERVRWKWSPLVSFLLCFLILLEFMRSNLRQTDVAFARKVAIGVMNLKHFLFLVVLRRVEIQPIVSYLWLSPPIHIRLIKFFLCRERPDNVSNWGRGNRPISLEGALAESHPLLLKFHTLFPLCVSVCRCFICFFPLKVRF